MTVTIFCLIFAMPLWHIECGYVCTNEKSVRLICYTLGMYRVYRSYILYLLVIIHIDVIYTFYVRFSVEIQYGFARRYDEKFCYLHVEQLVMRQSVILFLREKRAFYVCTIQSFISRLLYIVLCIRSIYYMYKEHNQQTEND